MCIPDHCCTSKKWAQFLKKIIHDCLTSLRNVFTNQSACSWITSVRCFVCHWNAPGPACIPHALRHTLPQHDPNGRPSDKVNEKKSNLARLRRMICVFSTECKPSSLIRSHELTNGRRKQLVRHSVTWREICFHTRVRLNRHTMAIHYSCLCK